MSLTLPLTVIVTLTLKLTLTLTLTLKLFEKQKTEVENKGEKKIAHGETYIRHSKTDNEEEILFLPMEN